jgi:hypothetical protein
MSDVVNSGDRVKPVGQVSIRTVAKQIQPYQNGFGIISPKDWRVGALKWTLEGVIPEIWNTPTYFALVNEAFAALSDQMPTEVSIANFLWEARELKDLIPKLDKSLRKSLAGNYLRFEFGWLPFLGDLEKLYNLCETVRSRIAYLRATRGRQTRVSFYRKLDYSSYIGNEIDRLTSDGVVPGYTGESHNIPGIKYKLVEATGAFRAGGYLYHELMGLDDVEGEIRAFVSALGLANPLAILWEAIPYSFVVDWFTRIGTLFDRLSIQPFEGTWEVTGVSNSIKESFKIQIDQHCYPQHNPRINLGFSTYERYVRFVGLPVPATALLGAIQQELNPKQQLLALALLNSK